MNAKIAFDRVSLFEFLYNRNAYMYVYLCEKKIINLNVH